MLKPKCQIMITLKTTTHNMKSLSIMSLSIMSLNIMTSNIMTLNIKTLSKMTFIITTFLIIVLGIKKLFFCEPSCSVIILIVVILNVLTPR
jgi:hypothetical protein